MPRHAEREYWGPSRVSGMVSDKAPGYQVMDNSGCLLFAVARNGYG